MTLKEMCAIGRVLGTNFNFNIVSILDTSLVIGGYTFNQALANSHSFQYSAAFIAQSVVPPPPELPNKQAAPFTSATLWSFVAVAFSMGLARTGSGVVISP